MKTILLLLLCAMIANIAFSQTETVVIPNGHSLSITKVVLDEQQKYLYSAEKEKIVMWDAANATQLYTFPVGDEVHAVAISHAGDKIFYTTLTNIYCYSTVTGKKIFSKEYITEDVYHVAFSPDDKQIWLPKKEGIAWVNTTDGDHDFLSNQLFENAYTDLYLINNNQDFLLMNKDAWEIRGTDGEIKKHGDMPENTEVTWYLPFSKMIAAAVDVDRASAITFINTATSAVVKKLSVNTRYDDLVLIPSFNDNHFLLNDDDNTSVKYKLYNTSIFTAEKNFGNISPVKYQDISTGTIDGENKKMYLSAYKDLFSFQSQTGKIQQKYKRTVASLGFDVFSSHEYNSLNGELNWVCDDSTLKRINLFTMKPERHTVIHTSVENVAISPGGDTIGVFDYNKSYVKNIATNKMIKPDGKIQTSSSNRSLFFFSNDGKSVYYADKVSGDKGLYQWNLTTDAKKKIYGYEDENNLRVAADKQTFLVIDKDKKAEQVYDLSSGKLLYTYNFPPEINVAGNYIMPSADYKTALVFNEADQVLQYVDVANSKLISTTNKYVPQFGMMGLDIIMPTKDLSLIVVAGADGEIAATDNNGKQLYREQAHNSGIRNIFFSPDDKIMYTVSYDQTIKVWNAKTGKSLGTLYLFSDSNDYVFVDEFGRFDGTEEGIKKLYYLKNRNVILLDLVYEKYYTPNLYQRLVNGEVFPPMPSDDLKKAPLVKIQYAEKQRGLEVTDDVPSYQNATGIAEITVNAASEDDAIDEIRLFQNGKVLNLATRNLIVEDDKSKTSTKKYTVNLLPGTNEIRAIALNTQRTESIPDMITVVYNSSAQANTNVTPVNNNKRNVILDKIDKDATLHLVVVGINAYKNPKMSLNYALADATAFKDEVEKDAKTVITNVKTYLVTDAQADKTGISAAFQQVQQSAKPQDVFLFYYAGHGVIADGNKEFYLVPNNVEDLNHVDEALKQNGIAAKDLQQYAINIQAQKQLFILDACQSAGAFADMLSSDGNQQKNIALVARSTGTHWMAASGAQQFANEFSTLGHGAFTYVLLQALKGEAASNKMITVDGLKTYMQNGVPALMKKYNGSQQTPASYGFGNDFPVEILK